MKWNQIGERLQTWGKDRFLLLFLAGIMLVIIAMPMENGAFKGQEGEDKKVQKEKSEEGEVYPEMGDVSGGDELEQYRQRLCTQLEQFLQSMDGAGKTKVYITMHSSSEIIVERNSPYIKRNEEETQEGSTRSISETENDSEVVLMTQSDGGQVPIVVKEVVPVVRGVVVAAQGADNVQVKNDITQLVMALFGIEEHKIRVVKLNT
ncbi:MAG: hypothetical protein E7289_00960 [Lachnospiraceae bacterium]|nr:hypothetical protein [Lachnospiraceae bacterium]